MLALVKGMKTTASGDKQGSHRLSLRTIIATFVVTTLFWAGLAGVLIWRGGKPGAQWHFTKPGELEVYQGAYLVQLSTTNRAGQNVLYSHTAVAPEKVVLTMTRYDPEPHGWRPLDNSRPQPSIEQRLTADPLVIGHQSALDLLDFRYQPDVKFGDVR